MGRGLGLANPSAGWVGRTFLVGRSAVVFPKSRPSCVARSGLDLWGFVMGASLSESRDDTGLFPRPRLDLLMSASSSEWADDTGLNPRPRLDLLDCVVKQSSSDSLEDSADARLAWDFLRFFGLVARAWSSDSLEDSAGARLARDFLDFLDLVTRVGSRTLPVDLACFTRSLCRSDNHS
jgi:hypothetical protein